MRRGCWLPEAPWWSAKRLHTKLAHGARESLLADAASPLREPYAGEGGPADRSPAFHLGGSQAVPTAVPARTGPGPRPRQLEHHPAGGANHRHPTALTFREPPGQPAARTPSSPKTGVTSPSSGNRYPG